MPIRRQIRPKVELKDVTITGLPSIGEGFPFELAKALHEMAKAASALATKCGTSFGSVGVLIGDIISQERDDA